MLFICNFRQSLNAHLRSKSAKSEETKVLEQSALEYAASAWNRAYPDKQELNAHLGRDIYIYAHAWLASMTSRYGKKEDLREQKGLQEKTADESWAGLWLQNGLSFNRVFDETPEAAFNTLADKILKKPTKPLGRILKLLESLGEEDPEYGSEVILERLRPVFAHLHLGHLKVLDTLVVLNPTMSHANVIYDLIRERTLFLRIHGLISDSEDFAATIAKQLSDRMESNFQSVATKLSGPEPDPSH